MVRVKPTFRDFSEKIQKKGCYALLTYLQNKNLKVKKANCPRNDQLLPEPKGRNQNQIVNYEKGLISEKRNIICKSGFRSNFLIY